MFVVLLIVEVKEKKVEMNTKEFVFRIRERGGRVSVVVWCK